MYPQETMVGSALLGDPNAIILCGDQLLVECARSSQKARKHSDSHTEALLGLEPAIADWRAEANFLQIFHM